MIVKSISIQISKIGLVEYQNFKNWNNSMPLKLPKVYSYVFNLLKNMLVINSHLNNCEKMG